MRRYLIFWTFYAGTVSSLRRKETLNFGATKSLREKDLCIYTDEISKWSVSKPRKRIVMLRTWNHLQLQQAQFQWKLDFNIRFTCRAVKADSDWRFSDALNINRRIRTLHTRDKEIKCLISSALDYCGNESMQRSISTALARLFFSPQATTKMLISTYRVWHGQAGQASRNVG